VGAEKLPRPFFWGSLKRGHPAGCPEGVLALSPAGEDARRTAEAAVAT